MTTRSVMSHDHMIRDEPCPCLHQAYVHALEGGGEGRVCVGGGAMP